MNIFFRVFIVSLVFPFLSFGQDEADFDLNIDVKKIYPYISVNADQLKEAKTLNDLNERFESDWVAEYKSVELSVVTQGTTVKAVGKNDVLTDEQKQLLVKADELSNVEVLVKYLPKNNLVNNEIKALDFSFSIDPDHQALFPGGEENMQRYLQTHALKKLKKEAFRKHHLTAVKFEIAEDGSVLNPQIAESSSSQKVDEILLEALCNMPKWQPATYGNGLTAKQEYVLLVGDMNSCVQNFFNTRTKWF